LQLLLPAVMSAQESARKLSCSSNLRQIALAIHQHHDVYGRLPSGGWHYRWVGVPERGTGPDQPGSWIYNILPFVEESNLHDLGKGLPYGSMEQAQAVLQLIETPVPIFNCPSRRLPRAYPVENPIFYAGGGRLRLPVAVGAKSDFAANVGSLAKVPDFRDFAEEGRWEFPQDLQEGDDKTFLWPSDQEYIDQHGAGVKFNGVIYARSHVRFAQITDGLSKVYLIGEKCLMVDPYKGGKVLPNQELDDKGDNEFMYAGFDNDSERTAESRPFRDSDVKWHIAQFGSVHPNSWNMAFADGSVRPLSYDIFLEIHRELASRDDGGSASPDDAQ
jgi:prepilin-type processing-associated H-X9-DG protein